MSINRSIHPSINFLKWPKWHSHYKDHRLGDISKLHEDMFGGIKKRFNSRRKVDSESAATTSVGSLFQMSGAATDMSSVTAAVVCCQHLLADHSG